MADEIPSAAAMTRACGQRRQIPQEPQIGSSAQEIHRNSARDNTVVNWIWAWCQSVHVRDVAVKTFDAAPLEGFLQHLKIEIDHQDLDEDAVVLHLFCV